MAAGRNGTREVPEPLAAWRAAGNFIIGYVGRLDRGKRIDTLLRAFNKVGALNRRLCIVGEGPEKERLQRLAAEFGIADQVVFLGFREDRLALMRGFDIFVLPSEREGIPRCLMEAMALSIAAVASDIPGCRNLVEDGVTGLSFSVGDYAQLAQQIERLYGGASFRADLGRAGHRHVRAKFSAAVMAARYSALYHDLSPQTTQSLEAQV